MALQGVKCLLAVIQASWVSHGASPQIKMQEHNPAFYRRAWEVTGSARRIISVVARRGLCEVPAATSGDQTLSAGSEIG